MLSTALFVTSICPTVSAGAEDPERPRVTARLVADTGAVEAGSAFRLGVSLEIEDGWHVYWRYPGGAGLATAVDFDLPDGFVAGPLEWPLPIAFTQSEGIPGYGYEHSVVLASLVQVPHNADPRSAKARAEVAWLACKGVCVLGSAELEAPIADLPVDPAFDRRSRALPRSIDDEGTPFDLSTTGGVADGVITHWLRWHGSPRPVEWFPDPSESLEVGKVRIQSRGGLTRIDAEVRRRTGATGPVDSLPSLIVVTDSDGGRRGWNVSTVMKNSTQ